MNVGAVEMMAAAALQIVRRERVACWPWRLRETEGEYPIGATCADCGRDVALPRELNGRDAVCIYCALDSGLVPAVEIEP